MQHRCDLHIHSTFSDGTLPPEELLARASGLGIAAIALTDHNTVAGLYDFCDAAVRYPVKAVPGVEFSTDWNGRELHILALFLPMKHFDDVTVYTEERNRSKELANQRLEKLLQEAGYAVSYQKIKEKTDAAVPNRAHFASELVALGYFDDLWDAFHRLLDRDAPFYQPPCNPDSCDTIRQIRAWGALPVLAHPLLELTPQRLRNFLDEACPAGLCAMEALYARFSKAQTTMLSEICRDYGILESGGSDFHGSRKPDIEMGSGTGNLCVPYSIYEALHQKALVPQLKPNTESGGK